MPKKNTPNEQPQFFQSSIFNYSLLSYEKQIIIQNQTDEIKKLVRRTAQNIIEIGQRLQEVKKELGHGNFGKWLEAEFNWSVATATKMMQVSQQFDAVNFTNLNFAPSALYILAAPSSPQKARTEALSRAKKGESITYSLAKKLVNTHKQSANHQLAKNHEEADSNSSVLVDSQRINPDSSISQLISSIEKVEKFNHRVTTAFFEQYLTREWFKLEREKQYLSIILCYLDKEALITPRNLTSRGSYTVAEVSNILSETIKRPTDLFTYYGEGNFFILLSNTNPVGANIVANEIYSKIVNKKLSNYHVNYHKNDQFCLQIGIFSAIPSSSISLKSSIIELKQEVAQNQDQEKIILLTV